MSPGSSFLLYSDGISEAMNASAEEYGLKRLVDYFSHPSASVKGLLGDVHLFTSGYPASDDITAVFIEARE